MSNPDIQSHELADMRIAADKAPFDLQQKFHALLDAFEEAEECGIKLDEAEQKIEKLEETAQEVTHALRVVFPDTPTAARATAAKAEFGEFVSEDAWHEKLKDSKTGEERAALIAAEVDRLRGVEEKLRARIDALEEAVENALSELGG